LQFLITIRGGDDENRAQDEAQTFRRTKSFMFGFVGLAATVSGGSIDLESVSNPTVRRFLGWSKSRDRLAPAAA
jgi:hypothetical protein